MTPSPATSTRRDGLLHELTEAECWAHLRSHHLGRIAYVVDGDPHIVPLNYLARDGLLWLRTTSYSQLAVHLPGQRAAFAVDHVDEHARTGWSVVVRGRAEHVLGAHPEVPSGAPDPSPWPDGLRRMAFCLTPDQVTGRALVQRSVAPAPGHGPGTIQRSHGTDVARPSRG
ncbi:pyridoxamine 5'-phosphate oxidase family protein [Nocardioides rubriscoriae]|uniref:pyridoxamine 5'-phosphate oxidase family protein n=1 Tax=Nocardioides rubriscoriae TaxID=642762 RepID=UPI0011E02CFD|nr:pyridoxamine 5'-phosphate oxidase family protein [Nocardioides rubriscoriae]